MGPFETGRMSIDRASRRRGLGARLAASACALQRAGRRAGGRRALITLDADGHALFEILGVVGGIEAGGAFIGRSRRISLWRAGDQQ